ncbi:hypothetical protein M0G43_10925 [Subsaxibacter sp. CAU 1640]|uniref:hypothetical protein n=1 Tax=Subsaxibacter sp. CAU 1640 TaxID=2933271 RepID=UPI002006312F|nr:hypothetical protein [Subsaxibacter sp. CAU 1640]MCK7591088.1 hypothetical protein [Subsaxibacter sp. CAU 1640]
MQNYRKWDFLVFTLLTLLAVLNGQTTVFYIIYFFWWNELARIIIDTFMYKRNPNAKQDGKRMLLLAPLGQMFIYFVFIVVFFGFMLNWDNTHITMINIQVLGFNNWFFNLNLLFVIAERIYIHKTHQPVDVSLGIFTPPMIVLHVSIIVGGVLMFFVVKNFPDTFTPNNLWGSVIIILPFLGFKMLMNWWMEPVKKVY